MAALLSAAALPMRAQALPPPTATVSGEGLTLPVYEGFEALAPLFASAGDTTLIVNFWATWCAPCVEELPYFEELTRQRGDAPYRVVLVNLDFRRQLQRRLLPFVKDRALQSTVVVLDDPDANAWIDRVDPEWSGAIPATLVFNKWKREFREQSFTRDELQTLIHSFTGSTE
ncbi:MAG: TlpA family protein disulfide reductase [Bacteroidetes bacterium]|nr:TlpA family protein disulfide reductase [Bacteroidota bacterium]